MKHLSKLAIMTICLIITALFTSACGGGGKSTPPSYPYYTDDSNLTLTDSLNADNIATADIFYSVDNIAKSSDEDQEILKAEPTANDKTKFKLPDNIDIANVNIKAIITYDSEGNFLDYFSSYDGVIAENGIFNINFENENGDFGGGTGTEADPYLISQPRHFVNINKKDDQGTYLYLDKYFKQDKNLDFTHLTGLKIVKAEDDKDITIETTNEKAPFYNEGHGLTPIGEIDENYDEYYFAGTYEGNDKTIDGIMFVNTPKYQIGLFTGFDNVNIQNLTIGENSIIFIDENNENYSNDNLYLGVLVSYTNNSTIKNCTNNAKIIVKNIEITTNDLHYSYINGIMACGEGIITNCTNNGNITIDKGKFDCLYANGIGGSLFSYSSDESATLDTCTNNGDITITNNINSIIDDNLYLKVSGIIGDIEDGEIKNCTNNGNIIVSNNSNLWLYSGGIIAMAYTVNITSCTNKRNIIISNNTITNNTLDCYITAYGVAYITNNSNTKISGCTNEGTITVTDNAEDYLIDQGELYNED